MFVSWMLFTAGETDRGLSNEADNYRKQRSITDCHVRLHRQHRASCRRRCPPEKCNSAWSMASPGGDTIAKDAATPLVLDFTMVDSDKDGTIDKDEFNKACSAGLVKADEATVKNMK